MTVCFVIVVFLITYFFRLDGGYVEFFPLWRHFTYPFCHANLFHLVANSIALYFVMKSIKVLYHPLLLLALMYISAVAASFFAYYDKPVVGASGIVYAGLGMLSYFILSKKLVFNTVSQKRKFFLIIAFSLAIGFLIPAMAGLLHFLSFGIGFSIAMFHLYK